MIKRFTISRRPAAGFTLVEIAIVLTITGVILGSGVMALTSLIDDARYNTTVDRMNAINRALAVNAQLFGDVPCPATPPAAQDATTGYRGVGCDSIPALRSGIVPYAWLNLPIEYARDGYGNYFTYTVNPEFANAQASNIISSACRTDSWRIPTTGFNRNSRKARFCCRAGNIANDLVIRDQLGNALVQPRVSLNPGDENTAGAIDVNAVYQTPVYVLVSHGRNGYGSYINGGVRKAASANINAYRTNELENENNDNVFTSAPYSLNQSAVERSYFDDIVVWKTADQLISAFGRDSCARP